MAEKEEDFGSRTGNQHIHPQDLLYCRPPGGGGYGNPFDRDVRLVEEDLLDQHISSESARRDYGVVWDEKTRTVDLRATEELRAKLRDKRRDIYIDQGTEPYARTKKRVLTYEDMKIKRG